MQFMGMDFRNYPCDMERNCIQTKSAFYVDKSEQKRRDLRLSSPRHS